MMAKNLVTLAIYNTNTVLKVYNLCEGLRKDQMKLKYLQDLFFYASSNASTTAGEMGGP